jgi:hypothetical protein
MVRPDRERLSGNIEVDESYLLYKHLVLNILYYDKTQA